MVKQIINYVNETIKEIKVESINQLEEILKENGWTTNIENTPSLAAEGTCQICCAPGCAICRINYA